MNEDKRRTNTQVYIPDDLQEKLLFIRIKTRKTMRATLLDAIGEYADKYMDDTSVGDMRRVLDRIGEVHNDAGVNMPAEDAGSGEQE